MRFSIGAAIVVAALVAMATFVNYEYFFFAGYTVLMFVVLATAWNILGGYAGYVNFGTPAFFGLGAYSAAVLYKATAAPLVVQIALAAVMAGLLGFFAGLLTLRLRGIFFAIATIAVTVIMQTVFINWRYAGGATGLQLLRPEPIAPFDSYIKMLFIVMVVAAIGSVALARYIERSWIGRGLRAIRDSEEAAEASGVPTLKLKLFACTLSGALMGVAGTAHWLGPVIGAVLLSTLQQIVTVTVSSELNVLIVGALLVLFVVLAPDGILGLFRKFVKNR
jgi:branched-chain amino acid transport system permease protein